MPDQVMIGGETRSRGLISGKRENASSWIGMVASAVVILGVLFLTGVQWWSILIALFLGGLAFAMWSEYEALDYQSPPIWLIDRLWARQMTKQGTAVFTPRREMPDGQVPIINAAGRTSTKDKEESRKRPVKPNQVRVRKALRRRYVTEVNQHTGAGSDVPVSIGHIVPMVLTLDNGENVCFIRHHTRDNGNSGYLSVMLEKAAARAGVVDSSLARLSGDAWGSWLASLASHGSFVSVVQETSRVVPWDYSDHRAWIKSNFDINSPEAVRESYAELIGSVHQEAEQHRDWVTLRIPRSAVWMYNVSRYGKGERGEMLAAWDVVKNAVESARARGIALRALGERRSAAVIRALQDPDIPIDMNEDVDWSTCWLPFDGRARDYAVFSGSARDWYTSTARVPRGGWSPGWQPVDFLRPIITGVSPAVVRTLSITTRLEPAGAARRQARQDVAADRIMLRKAQQRVTDGAEESQTMASQQRLRDLRPGMGAAGASPSFGLTFQSRSEEEFSEQRRIMQAAAEESAITRLKWMDRRHGQAWTLTLPLARGIHGKG